MQIVVVAIITARHIAGDPTVWDATGQLAARMLSALMTGVSGLVMGLVLMPLRRPWIGGRDEAEVGLEANRKWQMLVLRSTAMRRPLQR